MSISKLLNLPPNRAKIAVKAPTLSSNVLYTSLQHLGITADDLAPIDWRKKANLVHVKNQGDCGDCWAQSSASALSDRFMIKKNIQNLDIDSAIVTQCAATNLDQGCNGDNPYDAGVYFAKTGGVDSGVVKSCPLWRNLCQGTGCTNLPSCDALTSECITPNVTLYKTILDSVQSTAVTKGGELDVDAEATIINMKQHLMDGPYPVCFFVANDFYGPSLGYKWKKTNGVYINGMYNDDLDSIASSNVKSSLGIQNKNQWGDIIMENGSPAGHAVELVGWGMENAGVAGTIPCWYIKNSWGPDWNEDGYFRIAMNTAPNRYNSLLGLDVPVSNVILMSTGQSVVNESSLFGSGTVFSPDINTGDTPGTVLSRKAGGISLLWWLFIGIAIVALCIWLFWKIKHKNG